LSLLHDAPWIGAIGTYAKYQHPIAEGSPFRPQPPALCSYNCSAIALVQHDARRSGNGAFAATCRNQIARTAAHQRC